MLQRKVLTSRKFRKGKALGKAAVRIGSTIAKHACAELHSICDETLMRSMVPGASRTEAGVAQMRAFQSWERFDGEKRFDVSLFRTRNTTNKQVRQSRMQELAFVHSVYSRYGRSHRMPRHAQ